LFVDLVWSITETNNDKVKRTGSINMGDFSEEILTRFGLNVYDVGNISEEAIGSILQKAQDLYEENQGVEKSYDLVLQAKKNIENLLNDERKKTDDLQRQLEQAQSNVTGGIETVSVSQPVDNSKWESEINHMT
jgi:hypothetical protein